jgi:hypothetical protein
MSIEQEKKMLLLPPEITSAEKEAGRGVESEAPWKFGFLLLRRSMLRRTIGIFVFSLIDSELFTMSSPQYANASDCYEPPFIVRDWVYDSSFQ